MNTDRATFAAEFASAVSFGMWPVFGEAVLSTNFPGTEINESYLQAAYRRTDLLILMWMSSNVGAKHWPTGRVPKRISWMI